MSSKLVTYSKWVFVILKLKVIEMCNFSSTQWLIIILPMLFGVSWEDGYTWNDVWSNWNCTDPKESTSDASV